MNRNRISRIIPIALILIVIAIAVAALVSVGRALFSGGSTQTVNDSSQTSLISTAPDRSVRMTVRGSIVADENFRSYQETISPSDRTLTTYSGYLDQPISSGQLANNIKAYEEFVFALNRANMMQGSILTGDSDDTRGICATGKVYEFEILSGTQVEKRLWTSTCKGSPGSLKASVSQLESLFLQQIPTSKALLSNIKL
ncbi:MAG: hypothetical protein ABIQ04_04900 [Candidatus Saccharimonadales bacterium]